MHIMSGDLYLPPLLEATKSLVVLLHGYGSAPSYLAPFARAWQGALPHTMFAVLEGFEKALTGGRAWFDMKNWSGKGLLSQHTACQEGLQRASFKLDKKIQELMDRHQIRARQMCLMGFSQGAMLALHTGLARSEACAGVVACAGALLMQEEDLQSRPPVLVVHGSADTAVAPLEADLAQRQLRAWGIEVTKEMRPRLGHGIDQGACDKIGAFLARALMV
ncbi:MAG: hypothetical protein C0514_02015 [Candidatus Puniceispirillum sp.]|nr:hypothetical protein [Candidatus Puniceispirillum sp.]